MIVALKRAIFFFSKQWYNFYSHLSSKVYSEPSWTSKMERFAKIGAIFAKISISDAWWASEYASHPFCDQQQFNKFQISLYIGHFLWEVVLCYNDFKCGSLKFHKQGKQPPKSQSLDVPLRRNDILTRLSVIFQNCHTKTTINVWKKTFAKFSFRVTMNLSILHLLYFSEERVWNIFLLYPYCTKNFVYIMVLLIVAETAFLWYLESGLSRWPQMW